MPPLHFENAAKGREAAEKFGKNKWLPQKTFGRWHLIKESRDSNWADLGGAIQGFIISLIEQQIRLILGAALSVPSSAPSNGLVGGMICSIYGMAKNASEKVLFPFPLFWRCRYTSHNQLLERNVCKSVDRDKARSVQGWEGSSDSSTAVPIALMQVSKGHSG